MTSGKSLPFITINDALINLKFLSCLPIPIVLGIEGYLEGPPLNHLNTFGFVSIGFESGQHKNPLDIKNCETFISLALNHAGHLKLNNFHNYEDKLKKASREVFSIFEVIYEYHTQPKEDFSKKDGFESFQNIKKGPLLAKTNGKLIHSNYKTKLFMP
tara:strand:- start:48 stop:521 length:474 start_codon:yes stop_codon:yes gene_type:complete